MSDLGNFPGGLRQRAGALVVCFGFGVGWVSGVEVLRLPDGSWIGPPVVVEAKPVPPRAASPFDIHRSVEPSFQAAISEDKTLLRRLYEVLPTALQKSMKSPPAAPASTTVDSPVDKVLVFQTGGGWPVKNSRYYYALADRDGNIGEGVSEAMLHRVGSLVAMPAVVPKLSPEVKLMVWEHAANEYRVNFSKPPLAKMVFANPLYSKAVAAPLWPDGKVERECSWRGRTVRLEKALRVLHDTEGNDGKKNSAGVDFDFVVQGARSVTDTGDMKWFIEDNRGNFLMPRTAGSSLGHNAQRMLISHRGREVAFWPENLNWRLTLFLRPSNLAVMEEKEYRRIRIQHPRGKVEEKMVDAAFEINGVGFKNLRISSDSKPPNYQQLEIDQWYVPAVIEFEVVNAPQDVFVEVSHFYDGFMPFKDRPSEIGLPRPDLRGYNGPIGRIPVALDKQADFLEFVISVTREERLEFYFQPELLP